jgi:bacterioferritin
MDGERQAKVVEILNQILEQELAGVVRYTHYSLMVFGYSRIPIVAWFRQEAAESLRHAEQAGEMITHLDAYPSLGIGPLLDSHRTDLRSMLRESLAAEDRALSLYRQLLELTAGHSVLLGEYALRLVAAEEMHADEVRKMLRSPGEIAAPAPPPAARPQIGG